MTRSSKCSAAEKNFGEAMPERGRAVVRDGDNGKVSAFERATIHVNPARRLVDLAVSVRVAVELLKVSVAKLRDDGSPRAASVEREIASLEEALTAAGYDEPGFLDMPRILASEAA